MSVPKIIEGDKVFVIEPYPLKDAHRVYSWMKAFKTIIQSDESPKNKTEFVAEFEKAYPHVRSFGVLNKDNHELVGAIIAEPNGKFNMFMHAASRTSAFGSRMMDEAGEIVVELLFETQPQLTRLSALVHYKNNMAASLAKRVGFVKEGKLEDYIVQKGEPKALIAYGLTRRNWEKNKWSQSQEQNSTGSHTYQSLDSSPPSAPSSESLEGSLERPSEEAGVKVEKTKPQPKTLPGLPPEQLVEQAVM